MDLLLHVGLHKTGTTTVQHFLSENQKKLLEYDIFYPDIGKNGHQHSLIPACAWNGLHPIFKDKHNADLNYYLELLNKSLNKYKPKLTIMSSELWTETLFWENNGLDLILKIKPLFNKITLFVSKRKDFDYLSLSALKYRFSNWYKDSLPCNFNNIKFFFHRKKHFEFSYNFWKNCNIPLITKNLDDTHSGNLVDHYFGDIVEKYSKDARLILQESKEERRNKSILQPKEYLILFLLQNLSQDNETDNKTKKHFFQKFKKNLDQTTDDQLILYFKYFEKKYKNNDLDNIIWEDKINALKFAKILY